ncbi:hypothetical protein [Myxococcus sp. Y35]|uniref:hypothetical protein n=1 Tax=Pseudomyxococcus flavus TaxID=3115648 RepID=UPI003CF4F012
MNEKPDIQTETASMPSGVLAWVATLLLGAGLPLVLVLAGGASWRAAGMGALSWALGLALKLPVAGEITVRLTPRGPARLAMAQGLASAACELGMAAVLFRYADVSSRSDVVYAVSAGCIECLFLTLSAILTTSGPPGLVALQWAEGARKSLWIRNSMFVERVIAVAGHLGSRGLVGIALLTGAVWPALFAVLSFATTDGWAAFGLERRWNWYSLRTFRMFHGGCAAIAALEVALFFVLLQKTDV